MEEDKHGEVQNRLDQLLGSVLIDVQAMTCIQEGRNEHNKAELAANLLKSDLAALKTKHTAMKAQTGKLQRERDDLVSVLSAQRVSAHIAILVGSIVGVACVIFMLSR